MRVRVSPPALLTLSKRGFFDLDFLADELASENFEIIGAVGRVKVDVRPLAERRLYFAMLFKVGR